MKYLLVLLLVLGMTSLLGGATTVSLTAEGTSIFMAEPGTVTLTISTDAGLIALDAVITVTGGDIITGAINNSNCATYGWDPTLSSDPLGVGTSSVEIGLVRSESNTGPIVGYVDIAYNGGVALISIAAGTAFGSSADLNFMPPTFSTGVVEIRMKETPDAKAGPDQTVIDYDGDGVEQVILDGSASTDPNGKIVSYVWTEGANPIATGVNPTVVFNVGTHTITLTVTNDDGATDTDTVIINVNNPPIFYVDNDALGDPGPGDPNISDPNEDGSSEYPFDAIQEAINVATDRDTIIVLPGTYTGTGNRDIDFLGKAITVRSNDPEDPNIVAATIVDCHGTEADPHRGFYFHNSEGIDSIVAGLTITNGYGPNEQIGGDIYAVGGGIYFTSSSPAIRNCTFNGNSAVYGGGMYNYRSSPTLTNCTFSGNEAAFQGGGIYNFSQYPITGPTIVGSSV